MGDLLRRAEHYRKQAETYHELAKFAEPAYLGDFYRGVAVRYVFMSQEISKQAEKEAGSVAEPPPPAIARAWCAIPTPIAWCTPRATCSLP